VRKDLSVGFVVGKSGGKKITVAAGRKKHTQGGSRFGKIIPHLSNIKTPS